MTITTHTYTAKVGTTSLSVRGGSLTLDSGRAPHVEAELELAFPGTWTTVADSYSAWVEQNRNMYPDPGAAHATNNYVNAWAGTSNVITAVRAANSTWSKSGKAFRATWTTVATPGSNSLQATGLKLVISTTGKYTVSWRVKRVGGAGQPGTVGSATDFGAGNLSVASGRVEVASDEWVIWQTVNVTDLATFTAASNPRVDRTITGLVVGSSFELSEYDTYPGDFQPDRAWFSGAGGWVDALTRYAWAGTPNASVSTYDKRTITAYGGPVFTPSPATYDLLDPRNSPAPRVEVTASSGIPRTFNLHVRDRSINHKEGTVSLRLSSDEGLLDDFAPLADDLTPRTHEANLRNLVGYVLNKAIPGAVLEAGTTNADLTARWDATNRITNPTGNAGGASFISAYNCVAVTDATFPGTVNGVAHIGTHVTTPSSPDSYISIGPVNGMAWGMQVGKTYVFSAEGSTRVVMSGATANVLRERALGVHATGSYGGYKHFLSPSVPNVLMTGTNGVRVSVEFTVPPGTTDVFLRAYHGRAAGAITWGKFRLSEKVAGNLADNSVYFFGSQPAGGGYTYDWETGTANAAYSGRHADVERLPELFTWRAGQSALDFLHPLLQSQGLRLVCDETRKWTLRDETYEAPGNLSLRAGINVIEAEEDISRDGGFWFDARTTRYKWTDENGLQQERVDTYALTPSYSRMTLLELSSPYPGPGRSEYAVRRAQGIGREVTVETVSDWSVLAEQPVSVVLENAPTGLGKTQSVAYDLGTDRMTVTTRTVDTPAGAINLLPGIINALTGTINAL